jgi:hypothetical protein
MQERAPAGDAGPYGRAQMACPVAVKESHAAGWLTDQNGGNARGSGAGLITKRDDNT